MGYAEAGSLEQLFEFAGRIIVRRRFGEIAVGTPVAGEQASGPEGITAQV